MCAAMRIWVKTAAGYQHNMMLSTTNAIKLIKVRVVAASAFFFFSSRLLLQFSCGLFSSRTLTSAFNLHLLKISVRSYFAPVWLLQLVVCGASCVCVWRQRQAAICAFSPVHWPRMWRSDTDICRLFFLFWAQIFTTNGRKRKKQIIQKPHTYTHTHGADACVNPVHRSCSQMCPLERLVSFHWKPWLRL